MIPRKFSQIKLHGNTKSALLVATICASGLFLINNGINVQATVNTNQNQAITQASDSNLPAGISQDDVIASGLCGTAPYFITRDYTLYFMDGNLNRDDMINLEKEYGDSINKVDTSKAIQAVIAPKACNTLFGSSRGSGEHGFWKATSMDLSKLDTSNVTDMHMMFESLTELKNLNVSNFDTW